MNIKYIELHSPLFLGKKNHGTKVFNGQNGLVIDYHEDSDHVIISYNGETAQVQHYNYMVYGPSDKPLKAPVPQPGKVKAQVSTPQDHVFANGPGHTRN